MRIGNNPEKKKEQKLTYKLHRVIIPFYIPDTEQDYFKNLVTVLDYSLQSLITSIDHKYTNITLINNASCKQADEVARKYVETGYIDKYIINNENRGKVQPVMSEILGAYEDFLTVSDADALFFENWENAVFSLFNAFPHAGVVSPVPSPHLAYYCNTSLFLNSLLTKKVKYGNRVDERSFKLFEEGINNEKIFLTKARGKKYSWKDKQFFLEKNNVTACVGAGHFVSTYRRSIFNNFKHQKVEYVFKNGLEHEFLDLPCDKKGFYRLSTTEAYVYHLGNSIPSWVDETFLKRSSLHTELDQHINKQNQQPLIGKIPFYLRQQLWRGLKKLI